MNDQEPKITDISIYIAGLQATFRPAQDARHTTCLLYTSPSPRD